MRYAVCGMRLTIYWKKTRVLHDPGDAAGCTLHQYRRRRRERLVLVLLIEKLYRDRLWSAMVSVVQYWGYI